MIWPDQHVLAAVTLLAAFSLAVSGYIIWKAGR